MNFINYENAIGVKGGFLNIFCQCQWRLSVNVFRASEDGY
jgi:hypothetical protein